MNGQAEETTPVSRLPLERAGTTRITSLLCRAHRLTHEVLGQYLVAGQRAECFGRLELPERLAGLDRPEGLVGRERAERLARLERAERLVGLERAERLVGLEH